MLSHNIFASCSTAPRFAPRLPTLWRAARRITPPSARRVQKFAGLAPKVAIVSTAWRNAPTSVAVVLRAARQWQASWLELGKRGAQRRSPVAYMAALDEWGPNSIHSAIAIIITFSVSDTNPSGTLLSPPTQAHLSSRLSM